MAARRRESEVRIWAAESGGVWRWIGSLREVGDEVEVVIRRRKMMVLKVENAIVSMWEIFKK